MEQRSLRLGDIVDDYCPRERRLTNHAIVAIVEDAIRQTRCTTCDYEHVYKQGREPRRRKSTASLFEQVLTDMEGTQRAPARIVVTEAPPVPTEANSAALDAAPPADTVPAAPPPTGEDAWPGHRTLIRATLPKTDGEPPATRPIPEFTMHQKPQSARARQPRFMYGPQGDPFGRPPMRSGPPVTGRGNGNANGNTTAGNGHQPPGKRRGRRRRGKRSH